MIMKKFLSLSLCAAMLAPVTASAVTISAEESTAEIYSQSTKAGDTVTVPFSAKKGEKITFYFTAKDAPSAAGFLSGISYKMSYLRYDGTKSYYANTYSNSEIGFLYLSVLFDENGVNLTNETKIAAVTFTARKDIPESANALSYAVTEFYNSNLAEINHSSISCAAGGSLETVTPHVHTVVTDPERQATCCQTGLTEGSHCSVCGAADPDNMKGIYGDLDNDGLISSADALLVLRNSVELEVFNDIQTILADVDGDSDVTSADALEILRASVGISSKTLIGSKYIG